MTSAVVRSSRGWPLNRWACSSHRLAVFEQHGVWGADFVHLVAVGGQVVEPPLVLLECPQPAGLAACTVLACHPSRQIALVPSNE